MLRIAGLPFTCYDAQYDIYKPQVNFFCSKKIALFLFSQPINKLLQKTSLDLSSFLGYISIVDLLSFKNIHVEVIIVEINMYEVPQPPLKKSAGQGIYSPLSAGLGATSQFAHCLIRPCP